MERVSAEPQDLPCAHILGLLCRVGWYQYSTSSLNNGSTYLKLRVSCWALLRWAQPALCCAAHRACVLLLTQSAVWEGLAEHRGVRLLHHTSCSIAFLIDARDTFS